MAFVIADRVLETTTTTGTGALTLGGAVTGFRTFAAAMSNGDTCGYFIELINTGTGLPSGAWEIGLGTLGSGTFTRTTVLASSNSNAAVNFAAGTKLVGLSHLARQSGGLTVLGGAVVSTLLSAVPTAGMVLTADSSTGASFKSFVAALISDFDDAVDARLAASHAPVARHVWGASDFPVAADYPDHFILIGGLGVGGDSVDALAQSRDGRWKPANGMALINAAYPALTVTGTGATNELPFTGGSAPAPIGLLSQRGELRVVPSTLFNANASQTFRAKVGGTIICSIATTQLEASPEISIQNDGAVNVQFVPGPRSTAAGATQSAVTLAVNTDTTALTVDFFMLAASGATGTLRKVLTWWIDP